LLYYTLKQKINCKLQIKIKIFPESTYEICENRPFGSQTSTDSSFSTFLQKG